MRYKIFLRSCTNIKEFASARKITQASNLTLEEAKFQCDWYNKNRTSRQIRKGTMMEFTVDN